MKARKLIYRLTHWEEWEYRVKYIPMVPVWLWFCVRSRSLWFFTSSNPSITFGGMDGESKSEIYNQLPPGSFPKSIYISPQTDFDSVNMMRKENNFKFPFVVKPDKGMMGLLFRILENENAFLLYHQQITVPYIVQEYVPYPIEVSVFYYRFPYQATGCITGCIKKSYMEVIGDGQSSLWQLILKYQRAQFRLKEMQIKHAGKLDKIIPTGEVFILSHALNLSRGGNLISLETEKDEQLLKVFDEISHYTKAFYYGRYDIKCLSIDDLKAGKNYSILEFNGSGAEPHHIYGNGNSLMKALSILIYHWNILYKISKYNHSHGHPYWTFARGWKFRFAAKKNFHRLKKLEREISV